MRILFRKRKQFFTEDALIMPLLNRLPIVCKPGTAQTEAYCSHILLQETALTDAAVPK
jgi:hypothetical protein